MTTICYCNNNTAVESNSNKISKTMPPLPRAFRFIVTSLVLISYAAAFCVPLYAAEIDYEALQQDPIEDAFKKLTSAEMSEWDEGSMTGGDIKTLLSRIKWPLKTGLVGGRFSLRGSKGQRKHHGVDLLAPRGTPIYAALDGMVEIVSSGSGMFHGYGRVVFVNHGNMLWSLYSHCDTIQVKMGQRVKQGEQIATVGRTGRATAYHLHFEMRNRSGTPINPMLYLPQDGMLPSR